MLRAGVSWLTINTKGWGNRSPRAAGGVQRGSHGRNRQPRRTRQSLLTRLAGQLWRLRTTSATASLLQGDFLSVCLQSSLFSHLTRHFRLKSSQASGFAWLILGSGVIGSDGSASRRPTVRGHCQL